VQVYSPAPGGFELIVRLLLVFMDKRDVDRMIIDLHEWRFCTCKE
jgi:hypothetical protein